MSRLTLEDWGSDDAPPPEVEVPATEPSVMAQVRPRFGSRTSPETAPEADSAAEGWGKFPETDAFFVAGEIHTTCVHETVLFRPLIPAVCTSVAPTERYFESYAAKAVSSGETRPDILNFSGLSFSFA